MQLGRGQPQGIVDATSASLEGDRMNAPRAGRKKARSCVSLCDIVILRPDDQARTASHCLSSASRRVRSLLGHGVGLYTAGTESRAPRRPSAPDRCAMDPRPGRRSLRRRARSRGHPLGHPSRDRGRTELEALAPRPGGPSRRFASAEETLPAWCQRQAVARPRPQSTCKRAVETAALGTTEELGNGGERRWRRLSPGLGQRPTSLPPKPRHCPQSPQLQQIGYAMGKTQMAARNHSPDRWPNSR